VILGPGTLTVKFTPLLATPPTVTTTFPVVAPAGTSTTMLVAVQLVAVTAIPLNFTVLVPCVAPKFAPVMVTAVPTVPDVGVKRVMLGVVVPPPVLLGLADETKPAHPVIARLAALSRHSTTKLKPLFCGFSPERLFVNILSPDVDSPTPDAAERVPTHP
jgi:hypothetical protein